MASATIVCKVCNKSLPATFMRKSSKGRTIRHCIKCRNKLRCKHCLKVKLAANFKTHSGNRNFFFDDGEEMRIAVCYACDYILNKERYARYDRHVRTEQSIRHVILSNKQRWRTKTAKLGFQYDLSDEYLVHLWDKQEGRCGYTGALIDLTRGHSIGNNASLDRIDPRKGYVKGNVIWTTRIVNLTKGRRTDKEFLDFCRQVVLHHDTASSTLSTSIASTTA